MKKFVGTITFDKKVDFVEKEFNFVEISNLQGEFSYYIFGKINCENGEKLLEYFGKKAGIIDLDISFETEEQLIMFMEKIPKESNYELVSFEGTLIDFSEIIERFEENFEVISIREAEDSEKFGNKIVKVDFFY